jgi:hypothetical protein
MMIDVPSLSPERIAPSIAMAAKTSEQISLSRVKPLRGAPGRALDRLICSEARLAVAIDGFL